MALDLGSLVNAAKTGINVGFDKGEQAAHASELSHALDLKFETVDAPKGAKPTPVVPVPQNTSMAQAQANAAAYAEFMPGKKIHQAEISADQAAHLKDTIGKLSKEEQAALQGALKLETAEKDGKNYLIVANASDLKLFQVHDFDADKNGSAKALKAALAGDLDGAKEALSPLVKHSTSIVPDDKKATPATPSAQPMSPSDGPPKPPTSDNNHLQIDESKIANLKAPAPKETTGPGLEGVAKPAPSREAGIA